MGSTVKVDLRKIVKGYLNDPWLQPLLSPRCFVLTEFRRWANYRSIEFDNEELGLALTDLIKNGTLRIAIDSRTGVYLST